LRLPNSFGFVAAVGIAFALQAATGCGGAEFASDVAVGGSAGSASQPGDGGTEQGGSTGAGAPGTGGTILAGCRGPEDCSDGDPCTQDICNKDGVCVVSPQCEANQKCCEGDCGQCCENTDCDDAVACTDDICFAGACQHQPSPTSCGAGHYCSPVADCVAQEACSTAKPEACDDGDACTTDNCQGALCAHAFCDAARLCCPDSGCADECCTNQGCDSDDDPCTVGVCTAGKCSQAPRCSDGEQCCAGPDGATCGSCCTASDCGDGLPCTVDACIEGRCFNAPGSCDAGYTCDPTTGCKKDVECKQDVDCSSEGCGRCESGTCLYGCGATEVCCNNQCQGCCTANDCFDGIDCTDNACIEGKCKFTANNKLCPLLQTCKVAKHGCVLL